MLDSILAFALLFNKQEIIIPIVILGFYFVQPAPFIRSLIALLGGMVIVAYLKTIFLVPLKPHLGVGYAFPSGHMFAATVFWATLSWELRQKLVSLVSVVILSLIAIGLVHFNYHDVIDVLGGAAFGLAMVGMHILLHRLLDLSEATYGLLMLVVCLVIVYFMTSIQGHLYLALGALSGLTLGSLFFQNVPSKASQQILAILVFVVLGLIAYKGFPYILRKGGHLLTFIQYMFVAFSLRLSAQISSRV